LLGTAFHGGEDFEKKFKGIGFLGRGAGVARALDEGWNIGTTREIWNLLGDTWVLGVF